MKLLASIALAAVCSLPIAAKANVYDNASLRLSTDMTENDVVNSIGRPTRITMDTCGGNNGIPTWQCKIYTYIYSNRNRLDVFLTYHGNWEVNSWHVYD